MRVVKPICSIKLIVEVDGGYHARRATADASRDRKLARLGYPVVRVSEWLTPPVSSKTH
jgi:very-short-patch-repair endonuclease